VSGGSSSSRSTAATTTTAATATDLSIALHLYESLAACFVCPRASITTDGVSSSVINDQTTVFPLLPASGRQQGGRERERGQGQSICQAKERKRMSFSSFLRLYSSGSEWTRNKPPISNCRLLQFILNSFSFFLYSKANKQLAFTIGVIARAGSLILLFIPHSSLPQCALLWL